MHTAPSVGTLSHFTSDLRTLSVDIACVTARGIANRSAIASPDNTKAQAFTRFRQTTSGLDRSRALALTLRP